MRRQFWKQICYSLCLNLTAVTPNTLYRHNLGLNSPECLQAVHPHSTKCRDTPPTSGAAPTNGAPSKRICTKSQHLKNLL